MGPITSSVPRALRSAAWIDGSIDLYAQQPIAGDVKTWVGSGGHQIWVGMSH